MSIITKTGQKQKDTWVYTKMLMIDEVSFLVRKLDKNMRKLKERNVIYGGVHVFVGDFFQIFPVRGLPLFKNNIIQFNAINGVVFLNFPLQI